MSSLSQATEESSSKGEGEGNAGFPTRNGQEPAGSSRRGLMKQSTVSKLIPNAIFAVIVLIWLIPTVGVFVSSFRDVDAMERSGWWTVWQDFDQLTIHNYQEVVGGATYEYVTDEGRRIISRGQDLGQAFLNTLTVTIPAVIIPILMAAFAAYGFSHLQFKGRKIIFGLIVAMLVVPVQISLIPIFQDYQRIGLAGTYLGVWLFHTGFGIPLATYLLYNFMATIPKSVKESAHIDGATEFTIFTRLIIPLSVPALAAFSILQFLWVWNDLLVPMVFLSGVGRDTAVLTQRLMNLVGQYGQDWHLLTAGAFVSMVLPVLMFLALQKFFVRGMLAGSVKG